MRQIDADELIKLFPDNGEGAWTYNTTAQGYINAMPTVDQWHYPSKGEYPPMDKKVYLWTKGDDFPVVAKRHDFKRHDEEWSWDCYWGAGFILKHNDERIIAWQYIVPPKGA